MLGYRTYFEVADRAATVEVCLDEFRAWLRGKGYDPDAIGDSLPAEIATGVEASLTGTTGPTATIRGQVIERQTTGLWTSELTVHVPEDITRSASVLLDIHSPATDVADRITTGVPRLARKLLTRLEAKDSLARLADRPELVHSDQVDSLAAAIHDPDRRGLLFVAGSADSLPLKAWADLVRKLLRQSAGMASAYVLDAEATRLLEGILGPAHAVAPGTLRTFHPGVDSGSHLDARRHRILSTTRIVNDRSEWIAQILGRRARDNALEAELPPAFSAIVEELITSSDDALLTKAAPAGRAPASPETGSQVVSPADEAFLAAAAVMNDVLGVSDPSLEDWARLAELARSGLRAETAQADVAARVRQLRVELSEATQERRALTRRLEDEQLENAATYSDLVIADDELRRLRKVLLRTERAAEVYVAHERTDSEESPTSFVDLISQVRDLPGVVFTGDEAVTVRLDVNDPLGVWASKTWGILLALVDYVEASLDGRCERDVHGYLQKLPDGCRGYSANKHARSESEDVQNNTRFAAARMFPVPSAVDPDEVISMLAHFRIAQSGMMSPRLHYFDDVRRTGKVYVGYIGPHLPTKMTN
ncbi:hypothetical protein ABT341_04500 [Pseudonocardia alni]|uniref:hypothetical protein n=1 Tax=Pseudonocardia alni TaxID=33907 RepID=UPI003326B903